MALGENNGIVPTMPMVPANQATANGTTNDMLGMGGNWIWIILLLFLFGGRNGFGNFGNDGVAATPATNLINNDFLYTQSKIDNLGAELRNQSSMLNQAVTTGFSGVQQSLCSGFAGINANMNSGFNTVNANMNSGFNAVQLGLCNLNHALDSGFCGTNRNIDQVRFENAQNTCAITSAIGASTQAIKDLINTNAMQDLRDRNTIQATEIAGLNGIINNANQTATIVNSLRYSTVPPGVAFGTAYGVPA